MNMFFSATLLGTFCAFSTSFAFVPTAHVSQSAFQPTSLFSESPQINPNDLESPEERAQRMALVKQLQKSFYADSAGITKQNDGLLTDVPLWRVQWTELPGFQNVLNCHVPHYTHMFQGVVNGPKPWYFGHVYLPGGSENLDSPTYRLCDDESQACHVGVLMKVSDYQQLEDGRLLLIAQALSKFRVTEATQHMPYAVANVELIPDRELIEEHYRKALDIASELGVGVDDLKAVAWAAAKKAAVASSQYWEGYEYRNCHISETVSGGSDVSPIANYDASHIPEEDFDAKKEMRKYITALLSDLQKLGNLESPPNDLGLSSFDEIVENVLEIEREVWKDLDYLLQLLQLLNPGGMGIPIPTQLLVLLPSDADFPDGFKLDTYVGRLQAENAVVGTASKSPFIVADAAAPDYPDLRRAQRLSFGIWVLLDSLMQGFSPAATTRQSVLEIDSIWDRLDAALRGLNALNKTLKETLEKR